MDEDRYGSKRSINNSTIGSVIRYCKTNCILFISKICREVVKEKKEIGMMMLIG
jgi:hypothetical protein